MLSAVVRFGRQLLRDLWPRLGWRDELRASWGQPGSADSAHARAYFDQICARSTGPVVDDRTWHDLELPQLFTAIDTTITVMGRQCLYRQLRTCEFDSSRLSRRYALYTELRTNQALREELQLALKPLEGGSTAHLATVLLGPPPQLPRHHALVLPWVLVTAASVLAAITHLVPVWVPLGLFAINSLITLGMDKAISQAADALLDCARLLGAAERMAATRTRGKLPGLDQLVSDAPARRRLGAQIRWFTYLQFLRNQGTLDPGNPANILGGLIILVNFMFMTRLLIYVQTIGRFRDSREQWLSVFDLVGTIDAAIAVASFLERHPAHAQPEVASTPHIQFANGYHPLIRAPVKCSVVLDGRSALVTGSNMTGKTTFIKMLGVNVLLGHTLGFCFADRAVIPASPVRAFIRGDQSVAAGKSRYFDEAEAIRGFLAESQTGSCRIFVIDEPFSGTNPVERIALAKAVLGAIGRHAQALVTTHDVELQHLLGERFALFHFREDPAVEGFFDYQIHAGASTQRNAIRVLERLGFPCEILAEAWETAARIGR